MMQVPLQAVPNQTLTVILDNNTWAVTLKTVEDTTVVSLTLNNTDLLDSARAVAGALIIPSQYEESGNFLFLSSNNQLPYYTQFGVTQSLVYVSAAELAVFRTPPAPPITAADFNPIAALPLRFAPQGYL
ncbi:hypothetical protein [Fimbriiglobus ruber]|nr:hypothetical protein [Fimbriiglobus ruber]